MNRDKDFNEKMEEQLFRAAAEDLFACYDNEYPEDGLSEVEFSHDFEKNMDNFQKKIRRDALLKNLKKYGSRAAVVLIILFVSFSAVTDVEAVKMRFFNIFVKQEENFSLISLEEDSSEEAVFIAYLPEDFKLTFRHEENHNMLERYSNNDFYLVFIRDKKKNNILLDTEDGYTELFVINGTSVFFTQKNEENSYVWYDDISVNSIITDLQTEDVKNIFEKVLTN